MEYKHEQNDTNHSFHIEGDDLVTKRIPITSIISYRTGGSPEAVDPETGIVVEQGDVAGLYHAVVTLSSGDYSEPCRKRASELFDNSKCFSPYIKLYNKLIGGGKIIVLGVASVWSRSKGLYDFIALSQNPDFVVALVGISDEIKKELPDRIVAIGRTQDQHKLAMLYSMADGFVNPTYADMFPTVNLEALACGTPVITYRTGGGAGGCDTRDGMGSGTRRRG